MLYLKKMKVFSSAFRNGEMIPAKYTCQGENINPLLRWEEVPAEAKSLVLIADDPDAPAGTWVHWLVWNINPKTGEIKEGETPSGAVLGTTSFGSLGYGGPCPPSGVHRYFFKLYAVDEKLTLEKGAGIDKLEKAIEGHILDKAVLMGRYQRK